MIPGITSSASEKIIELLRHDANVEKAVLFGSRAKGTYRQGSDIDIALYGNKMKFIDFLNLKVKLDELELLEKIDVVQFEKIENPDFIAHIDRVGVVIYLKGEVNV
jgi:predicted nucleotidyltransferase